MKAKPHAATTPMSTQLVILKARPTKMRRWKNKIESLIPRKRQNLYDIDGDFQLQQNVSKEAKRG